MMPTAVACGAWQGGSCTNTPRDHCSLPLLGFAPKSRISQADCTKSGGGVLCPGPRSSLNFGGLKAGAVCWAGAMAHRRGAEALQDGAAARTGLEHHRRSCGDCPEALSSVSVHSRCLLWVGFPPCGTWGHKAYPPKQTSGRIEA